ncbi:helix-turn-helix domain-containing protein (plasmid) [Rhizobium leguminosarum bv. viciae 248]|uniref:Helix-turn-helix protein n=3 Tax=Rhizobium TaxID=379 RepID=A0A1S9GTZ2_9HYPH|nr:MULTISPECIES: helix-turn-helix domain-containing protein [Rhizobium]MBB3166572.1 transcriptional regulator with XRE-family HTH domain [Rhizobium laguerreae]MBY3314528.1 helix-turn-helix domain-containing protein [Rhizobium laguerreae]MBY3381701.1 helix-turn-helix domain-containing protein [Rhizobium laguerreae]MBY5325429.1 helix-turn-helix domain-containing protein [Rhizobium leguminosarum]MBY5466451.1 helix-turn-helix domain-containing protein [Rhizobium leguminosarum]
MNMVSNITKSQVAPSVGALLVEARLARGYSLDDVAETTGLTVAEVTALENDADFDASRIRRIASALGILEKICDAPR